MDNELFLFIQDKIEAIRQGKYKGYYVSLTEAALAITTPERKYTIHPATLECTSDADDASWITSNEAIFDLFSMTSNDTEREATSITSKSINPSNKLESKLPKLSRRFK